MSAIPEEEEGEGGMEFEQPENELGEEFEGEVIQGEQISVFDWAYK